MLFNSRLLFLGEILGGAQSLLRLLAPATFDLRVRIDLGGNLLRSREFLLRRFELLLRGFPSPLGIGIRTRLRFDSQALFGRSIRIHRWRGGRSRGRLVSRGSDRR